MKKYILTFIAFFLLLVSRAQSWQSQWISTIESKTDNNIWQWADLLGHFTAANSFRVAVAPESLTLDIEKAAPDAFNRSKAILLDGTPADFRPILQIIDNYDRNAKLGTIFEARVGKGKLLVCAMDLETDLEKCPAAKQLLQSLQNYASGDKFSPDHELSVEFLDKILTNMGK